MGLFERFSSNKGKSASKSPKTGKPTAEELKKKAFASVPSSEKEEAPKAKATKVTKENNKEKKSEAAPSAIKSKDATGEAYRFLLRPIVTEKSSRTTGQYTFEVPVNASKVDVRHAVLHTYGVQPVAVNVIRHPGKVVRYGRFYGRTKKYKKAIVTLPAGKTIEVFSA